MADNNVRVAHLSAFPSLYEPARKNCFELVITGIDRLLKAGVDPELATEEDYLTDSQTTIRVAVDQASIPNMHTEVLYINGSNFQRKFAGRSDFPSGNMRVNDYVGANTKDILLALVNQHTDVVKEVVRHSSNYKHNWQLIEWDSEYTTIIRKWELQGAWIHDLDDGNWDWTQAELGNISCTVEFDKKVPIKINQ